MHEVELQRAFYRRTATTYHGDHVAGERDHEHVRAMAALAGFVRHYGFASVLDVGCGTGRALLSLGAMPDRPPRLVGLEPVAELRQEAVRLGVNPGQLVEGDAARLPFADGAFDCVCAFGVMHHLPRPRLAVEEMLRVARRAVFISDLNNFGCGSTGQRLLANSLRVLRLWRPFQYVKNGFHHWKYDEHGDGLSYSYSLFDNLPLIRSRSRRCLLLTTDDTAGRPRWDASHVAVLALMGADA